MGKALRIIQCSLAGVLIACVTGLVAVFLYCSPLPLARARVAITANGRFEHTRKRPESAVRHATSRPVIDQATVRKPA
jgi:hypothetical protein